MKGRSGFQLSPADLGSILILSGETPWLYQLAHRGGRRQEIHAAVWLLRVVSSVPSRDPAERSFSGPDHFVRYCRGSASVFCSKNAEITNTVLQIDRFDQFLFHCRLLGIRDQSMIKWTGQSGYFSFCINAITMIIFLMKCRSDLCRKFPNDAPPCEIQFTNGTGRPFELIRDELHESRFAILQHTSLYHAHFIRIFGTGVLFGKSYPAITQNDRLPSHKNSRLIPVASLLYFLLTILCLTFNFSISFFGMCLTIFPKTAKL